MLEQHKTQIYFDTLAVQGWAGSSVQSGKTRKNSVHMDEGELYSLVFVSKKLIWVEVPMFNS